MKSQTIKKGSIKAYIKYILKNVKKAFGAASRDVQNTKAAVRKVDIDKRAEDGNTDKYKGTKKER